MRPCGLIREARNIFFERSADSALSADQAMAIDFIGTLLSQVFCLIDQSRDRWLDPADIYRRIMG